MKIGKIKRNQELRADYLAGAKVVELVAKYGITRQRVYQILDGLKREEKR